MEARPGVSRRWQAAGVDGLLDAPPHLQPGSLGFIAVGLADTIPVALAVGSWLVVT
jgi:hypothetical protein